MIKLGEIIHDESGNEYEIQGFLGKGGMGYVHKAKRISDDKLFAIKTLPIYREGDTNHKALINEGELAIKINNLNVIKYIYFHDGKKFNTLPPYIIMEIAEDGSLNDILKSKINEGIFFKEDELIKIYKDLINGMSAINELLIHRDIKPENILVCNGKLKISDFGISKISGDITRGYTFKGYGTLHYLSPEIFSGKSNSIQMDIYSLGIIFYQLATLKHPYNLDETIKDNYERRKKAHLYSIATPAIKINKTLSPKISSIINKMIEKNTSNRYKNWEEIKKEFNNVKILETCNHSESIKKMIEINNIKKTEATEKEMKLKKEQDGLKAKNQLIIYQFENEIIKHLDNFIEEFNSIISESDEKINKSPYNISLSTKGYLYGSKNGKFKILVSLQILNQCDISIYKKDNFGHKIKIENKPQIYNNKEIIAWGIIEEISGGGFNIILNEPIDDEIYGSWSILENEINPIARIERRKTEKFPFNYQELKNEIHFINSLHVYKTKISGLDSKKIIDFFTEIYNNV